ncbi:hypothetical protein [Streptomyces sp. NBC_00576]|uniref:hypothetical protein n=1 Tax=Streptomyces sp. NBC_00576 TaxID=2903665 RepID=UPI002E81CB7C|nr:hypothetical protein [Streptomyces sp. NBC_00576]WUB74656.1 hypothetical protein OG734_33955 [Streptomyces sp. NBC_00576]
MRFTSLGAVGVAAVLAGIAAAGPSPAAPHTAASLAKKPTDVASVHGSARVSYAYAPDDDIRFTVDAEAVPFARPMPGSPLPPLPTHAEGTVTVKHYSPARNSTGWSKAKVDCLVTGVGIATLTAVVEESNVWEPGKRFGLSVQRGRGGDQDHLGFGWDIVNLEPRATEVKDVETPTGTCMAPAPFAPVIKGGFTVKHTDLPPLPAAPKAAGKSEKRSGTRRE